MSGDNKNVDANIILTQIFTDTMNLKRQNDELWLKNIEIWRKIDSSRKTFLNILELFSKYDPKCGLNLNSSPESVITVIKRLVEFSVGTLEMYEKKMSTLEQQIELLETNVDRVDFKKLMVIILEKKNNNLKKKLLAEDEKMYKMQEEIVGLELRIKQLME